MIVSIIVAASTNNVIGKNNEMLWHLPNDFRFFKSTTWAMPVVMGRKTFESMGSKPLGGRLNIVITRQKDLTLKGVEVVNSLKEAISVAKKAEYKELFVAGGGELYKEALDRANKIYLTRVHTELEGDTFFPVIDESKWTLVSDEFNEADNRHTYNYSFQLWKKK